jgi:hypothetical protein
MMEVQKYLSEHGLGKLVEEFAIVVTDYPDRVVLNYNQIDSPRFHAICDECRALILHRDTWKVMARSFDRFYNVGEGQDPQWKTINFNNEGRFEEKRDGSLLSVYWDGDKWSVSTRKMAFAEGTTPLGMTFRQLFDSVAKDTNLWGWLNGRDKSFGTAGAPTWQHTFVFELTTPENRVVTPYQDRKITLLGVRNNDTGEEIGAYGLEKIAEGMGVPRPKRHAFWSMDEAIEAADKLEAMEEGFVIVVPKKEGSHYRVKCKNAKFVAIAHMRENGGISPKRIMTLIIVNEQHEYLGYFPEDQKYFDFCNHYYQESLTRLRELALAHLSIEDQKEFALTIMPLTQISYEKGVLFQTRKIAGLDADEDKILEVIGDVLRKMGGKKIAQALGLRAKFLKEFGLESDEEE